MPNKFIMFQVITHDDGSFTLNEIIACPKCAAMIPQNSHWWGIHEAWHESMERKAGAES